MRPNHHGIRHLKSHPSKGEETRYYYWNPPAFVRRCGIFKIVSLGTDRENAISRTNELNIQLAAYVRSISAPLQPKLDVIKPMTTAWLARLFEASPKFARYSAHTRKEYLRGYRSAEIYKFDGRTMFGELSLYDVTRQIAYGVYENFDSTDHPYPARNIATAWQAAFKYATLKVPGVEFNPFTRLDIQKPPPRRQRWTNSQLDRFIKAANDLGFGSVGLCVLMCMELAQRPGDICRLKWRDYDRAEGYITIRQSKKLVEVRIPPTRKLKNALRITEMRARKTSMRNIEDQFICPTLTGKTWHKRNLARTVRLIGRTIGLPDELQIRDLRRTAATEAASAGATIWEMMAAGGWQHQASIQPYLVWTPENAAKFQEKREAYRRRNRFNQNAAFSERV